MASVINIVCTTMSALILVILCIGLLPLTHAHNYDVSLFRTYFGCADCEETACKNPVGCELVKEPGVCGCCMECAKLEGESCGVGVPRCSKGLQCNPPANALDGLDALVNGKGICEPKQMNFRMGTPGKFQAFSRRGKQTPRRRWLAFSKRF